MINLVDYGFIPTMMPEDVSAIPARITAVHKERYEIICEYGQTFASLIYDDTETENLHEYFRRLIPAYIKGISEYLKVPLDFNKYIQKIILIVFGYRTVQNHMFTESPEVKEEQVKRLQKIYEMRDM